MFFESKQVLLIPWAVADSEEISLTDGIRKVVAEMAKAFDQDLENVAVSNDCCS